jgi:hypothetical protein
MFAEFDGKPVAELEAFASRYGTRFIGPPIPSEGNPEKKGKEPYFFKALIEVQGYEIHPSRRSTACLFREGRGEPFFRLRARMDVRSQSFHPADGSILQELPCDRSRSAWK